jgi:GNAT superfamily N-acetyltransferase
MPDLDLELPPGHQLVSFSERPDLVEASLDFNSTVWPEFMLQDAVIHEHWHLLWEAFTDFQLTLLDANGAIAATTNSAPLAWDGSDADLPDGFDAQLQRSAGDHEAGAQVDTLGALQIVVDPNRRGTRLAGVMLHAMRANARLQGFRAVIACVRPTDKHRYPLAPIDRYARWTRADGEPFDAWVRLHTRLGGRIVRGAPESMTMRGSVAEWEAWTGMSFPESGPYVISFAIDTVAIDRESDIGVYHDPNIWIVHDLGT